MTKEENKKEFKVSELAEDFLIELGLNKSEIQYEKFPKKKKQIDASDLLVKNQDIKKVLTQKPLIIERKPPIRELKEENRQLKDEIDNLKDKIRQLNKFSEDIKLKDQIIKKIKDKHKNMNADIQNLRQELLRTSEIRKSFTEQEAIIAQLSKELEEKKKENAELLNDAKNQLKMKKTEIDSLKQSKKNLSEELQELKKKQELLATDIRQEIKREFIDHLVKKIDLIDKMEQTKIPIETITGPLANKIHQLNMLIKNKEAEIEFHLEEINNLKIEVSKSKRINERLKNAYDRINQQNITLQEELQKYIEENEKLKK